MSKARIVIVTASVGEGHNQAAKAIREALQGYNIEVPIVDFFASRNSYLAVLLKEAYLGALRFMPEIYEYLYRYTNRNFYGERVKQLLAHTSHRYMKKIMAEYKPEVLVFTHPFPCAAAAGLKREQKFNVPFIGVITDFAIHRLWQYPEVNYYCIPDGRLREQFDPDTLQTARIVATGIPISSLFKSLKTKATNNNVLVMGGGLGLGPIVSTVERLHAVAEIDEITIVCGRNPRMYRVLKKRALVHRKMRVHGFTKHVPELMAHASLLITKAGALTCSEAMAVGLPLILCHALPGQEEENARYLEKVGVAAWAKTQEQLVPMVQAVICDAARRQAMQKCSYELAKPNAAVDVAKLIMEILAGKS